VIWIPCRFCYWLWWECISTPLLIRYRYLLYSFCHSTTCLGPTRLFVNMSAGCSAVAMYLGSIPPGSYSSRMKWCRCALCVSDVLDSLIEVMLLDCQRKLDLTIVAYILRRAVVVLTICILWQLQPSPNNCQKNVSIALTRSSIVLFSRSASPLSWGTYAGEVWCSISFCYRYWVNSRFTYSVPWSDLSNFPFCCCFNCCDKLFEAPECVWFLFQEIDCSIFGCLILESGKIHILG
jgi:hypothetical protein